MLFYRLIFDFCLLSFRLFLLKFFECHLCHFECCLAVIELHLVGRKFGLACLVFLLFSFLLIQVFSCFFFFFVITLKLIIFIVYIFALIFAYTLIFPELKSVKSIRKRILSKQGVFCWAIVTGYGLLCIQRV